MKQTWLLLAMACSLGAAAQKKPAKPETFAATINEADMKKHLYTLASKEFEGRETASEGQRKAAAYISEQFKSFGLLPGNKGEWQLQYPVYRDSAVSSTVEVNGGALTLNNDYQPIQMFNTTSDQYFSKVTVVGTGVVDSSWDDYHDADVKGKVVLVLDGSPANYKASSKSRGFMMPAGTYGKIMSARTKGAAAILLVGQGFPRRQGSGGPSMYNNIYKETLMPNTWIISEKVAEQIVGAGYKELKEQAKAGTAKPVAVNADVHLQFSKTISRLQSSNVLGVIEGTDKKDEWLIISAHYDHLGKRDTTIYYGADDDGSGTTSVIEIAEAFAKAKAAGQGPRRSILFTTVSGEEKGLWGSEYYSEHPVYPLDKTTADLNIDMVGRVDTERKTGDTLNYVYVVGDDKISSDLKVISEGVNNKNVKMTLDYKFNDPNDPEQIYFRSDHYNFARKGVPIIFYYDGMLKADYHKPTDTPDKIYYTLMKKRAQLVFYTAWEMANRDAMLVRDKPLPEGGR